MTIRPSFSIGEVAKLFRISVQALRHYDKLGLLKPNRVNPENNYRYYSIDQFLYIDFIRYFKTIGMSLEEIKSALNRDLSAHSISELLKEQQDVLDGKIDTLIRLRDAASSFSTRLDEVMSHRTGEVALEPRGERKVIAYDYSKKAGGNFELGLRKVLRDVERNHSFLKYEPGVLVSYDSFEQTGAVHFEKIIVELDEGYERVRGNVLSFPEGMYAVVVFEDSFDASANYYSRLVDYLRSNSLQPASDFIHSMVVSYVDGEGQGRTLHEVAVLSQR